MDTNATHIPALHARTSCSATFGMAIGVVAIWLALYHLIPDEHDAFRHIMLWGTAMALVGARVLVRPWRSVELPGVASRTDASDG